MKKSTNDGSNNLDLMDYAPSYLDHVAGLIQKYLPTTGLIVDFGAGNGEQTRRIGVPTNRLVCVENDQRRATDLENIGYVVLNETKPIRDRTIRAVYSVNCLEHLVDDRAALNEMNRVLEDDGVLILYVPAMKVLYSAMDAQVGHIRRYSKRELVDKVNAQGFVVSSASFVDSLGAIASLGFKLIGSRSGRPSRWAMVVFDRILLPISKLLDNFFSNFFGKNLLVVASVRIYEKL